MTFARHEELGITRHVLKSSPLTLSAIGPAAMLLMYDGVVSRWREIGFDKLAEWTWNDSACGGNAIDAARTSRSA